MSAGKLMRRSQTAATVAVDFSGMGDRVVDCARLESVCAPKGHRGFESLPIRQVWNRILPNAWSGHVHSRYGDSNAVRPVGRVTRTGQERSSRAGAKAEFG